MALLDLLARAAASITGRSPEPPPTDGLWRSCQAPFFPVRLIDGGVSNSASPLWRRFDTKTQRWEYQQDPEDPEDWADRNAW